MSTIPVHHALAELKERDGTLYCSFCVEPVPEHLHDEQPCPLCHEFSFLCELVGHDSEGRKQLRMARHASQATEVPPLIAGRVRRHEYSRS
jgi:hypothetical protein